MQDLSLEEIRFRLNRKGMRFADVDRLLDLKPGTARNAARVPNRAGEKALAKVLKLSPREIWPSRYAPSGVRLKPQPRTNYTNPATLCGVKKSKAA